MWRRRPQATEAHTAQSPVDTQALPSEPPQPWCPGLSECVLISTAAQESGWKESHLTGRERAGGGHAAVTHRSDAISNRQLRAKG